MEGFVSREKINRTPPEEQQRRVELLAAQK
jgi:hypothetical protein